MIARYAKLGSGIVLSCLLGLVLYHSRDNSDALWNIVSSCTNEKPGSPSLCLKLDRSIGYAVIKDRRGDNHFLLIPTQKLSGIESVELLKDGLPNYFELAWDARGTLSNGRPPIGDDRVALAINSKVGRSQEQLHIHISCLKQDVRQQLAELKDEVTPRWTRLTRDLEGSSYFAKRVTKDDLAKVGAFRLLHVELGPDAAMGDYGIAIAELPDKTMVLLAVRQNIWRLDFASAGKLLDEDCLPPAP